MLGLEEEKDVQGYLYLNAVSDADRQRIEVLLARAYAGETGHFEFNASGPQGKIYKSCFVPIKNKEGGVEKLMGITEDVTEHNKADELLHKSFEEIEDLYNCAPCGYHSLDKDGIIIQINDTELGWLGYTRDELTGKIKWIDIITPASQQTFRENFPLLKTQGFIRDFEIEIIRKDGSILIGLLTATAVYDVGGDFVKSRTTVFDITERKRLEQKLVERETLFSAIFNQASSGIELIDPVTLRFIEVNPAACRMLGYTHEEFLRLRLFDTQADLNEEALVAAVRQVEASGGMTMENRHRSKNGDILDVEINSRFLDLPSRRLLIGTWQDITERKRAESKIKYLAYHDQLTELPNRELFYDRLSQAISQAKRKHMRLALLFLDLDGFKAVNDSYGHEAGDGVLQTVARRLQACVRGVDTVARLGGDEFIIILSEVEKTEDVPGVAAKIIQKLEEPILLNDAHQCSIGASIGIAIYPEDGYEIDKLMSAADSAMYESKAKGKNRLTFFKNSMSEQVDRQPWIAFDEAHLLGVSEIDLEHQELANMINKINEVVKHNLPAEAALKLFDEMISIARRHFETEDLMMDKCRYPEAEAHKQAHRQLVGEANYLRRQFIQGGELLVLQYLKDWLLPHILGMDKPLANYLIQHKD